VFNHRIWYNILGTLSTLLFEATLWRVPRPGAPRSIYCRAPLAGAEVCESTSEFIAEWHCWAARAYSC